MRPWSAGRTDASALVWAAMAVRRSRPGITSVASAGPLVDLLDPGLEPVGPQLSIQVLGGVSGGEDLDSTTVEVLREWRNRRAGEDPNFNGSDHEACVFARADGGPTHPHLLSDAYKKLVKRAAELFARLLELLPDSTR